MATHDQSGQHFCKCLVRCAQRKMRETMRGVLLGCVALLMLTAGSTVSRATDAEDCQSSNYELRFSACSRIIAKGGKDEKVLSEAYRRRGYAYEMKGEHDRAITDFN